jgi:pimeloyl-ACP methyl ester carboxylesterase
MTHFLLVHGAWHGGWAFDALVGELARRGHTGVAPDLPTGPDAGIERCVGAVLDALAAAGPVDGPTVVVGHSLGALIAPVVAARVGADAWVDLAGFIPVPGEPAAARLRREQVFAPGWAALAATHVRTADGCDAWPPGAAEAMYPDCDPAVARAAAARLRPQAWTALRDPCPLAAYPAVPVVYVLARGDNVIDPAWSRRAACDLLGVAPVELDGGHVGFLCRPGELADVLEGIQP